MTSIALPTEDTTFATTARITPEPPPFKRPISAKKLAANRANAKNPPALAPNKVNTKSPKTP